MAQSSVPKDETLSHIEVISPGPLQENVSLDTPDK